MKKIEAIIRASRFEEVKVALSEHDINFFTFYEVKGYGHQAGTSISYRGSIYDQGFIARIKLEIIIPKNLVEEAIDTIKNSAFTGEKGDGLISISTIEKVVNIRTGLEGPESINR